MLPRPLLAYSTDASAPTLGTALALALTLAFTTGCPGRPLVLDASLDAAGDDAALDVASDIAADAPDAPPLPAQFTVFVDAAHRPPVATWAELTRLARVTAVESATPRDDVSAAHGDGIRIAALADLTTCHECYRLERITGGYAVHGDDALGLQYGLTHLLEAHGYRFFHPYRGHAPADPATATVDATVFDHDYIPEQRRRGVQLHTLHPIESIAFWSPSADHLEQSRTIMDWVIRNRGNFVQIVGLDDIQTSPDNWRPHMRAILDEAHQRGIRMGVNIELFGSNNLQHAFDLVEDPHAADIRTGMTARLHTLLDGMPFDTVCLTFGEFGGVEPDLFISSVNTFADVVQQVAPGIEMTSAIHVGNYPDLHITYMGHEMLYYFLVQYADPRIVPWVHTVMYYTLFDDAGGAYLHDQFDEHRTFLLDHLHNRQPVAYFPESAYWIAFDDSVPQYHPVYMRSRWRDMSEIRRIARMQGGDELQEHVLFSSGWEWGYWQTDAATLRMGFHLPDHWQDPLEEMFAPYGEAGHAMVTQMTALGDLQFDALIGHRLAPYIAGRDAIIDAGESMRGIVAAPTRPSFDSLLTMDATTRATFVTNVLDPLDALATSTEAIRDAVNAIPADTSDPFVSELRDSLAVDAARARFAASIWRAAERFASTGSDAGFLATAQTALAAGHAAVMHRHANLHWPEGSRLISRQYNPTVYRYGYLYFADSLCYWERELEQVRAILEHRTANPPACFLVG
jgi:hypothetical protein